MCLLNFHNTVLFSVQLFVFLSHPCLWFLKCSCCFWNKVILNTQYFLSCFAAYKPFGSRSYSAELFYTQVQFKWPSELWLSELLSWLFQWCFYRWQSPLLHLSPKQAFFYFSVSRQAQQWATNMPSYLIQLIQLIQIIHCYKSCD